MNNFYGVLRCLECVCKCLESFMVVSKGISDCWIVCCDAWKVFGNAWKVDCWCLNVSFVVS